MFFVNILLIKLVLIKSAEIIAHLWTELHVCTQVLHNFSVCFVLGNSGFVRVARSSWKTRTSGKLLPYFSSAGNHDNTFSIIGFPFSHSKCYYACIFIVLMRAPAILKKVPNQSFLFFKQSLSSIHPLSLIIYVVHILLLANYLINKQATKQGRL